VGAGFDAGAEMLEERVEEVVDVKEAKVRVVALLHFQHKLHLIVLAAQKPCCALDDGVKLSISRPGHFGRALYTLGQSKRGVHVEDDVNIHASTSPARTAVATSSISFLAGAGCYCCAVVKVEGRAAACLLVGRVGVVCGFIPSLWFVGRCIMK
jgi:hypothetical protein